MPVRRLSPQDTGALLEQAASGLPNAEIAELAGAERTNTVTDWRAGGMPSNAAALMLHRLALRKDAEAVAAQMEAERLRRIIRQFQLD